MLKTRVDFVCNAGDADADADAMAGVIHCSMGMAWAVASVGCVPTSSLGTPSKCIMLPLNQQFIFFKIITEISHHYSNFILIYEHPDKQSLNKDAGKTLSLLK